MLIRRESILTGVVRTRDIPCDPEDFAQWQLGNVNIQVALPYLSDGDREFILTGITDEEWDNAFSEIEEDIDDSEDAF